MKHVHLLHDSHVAKQDVDLLAMVEAFVASKPIRPEPSWYADLLEQHSAEIATVVAMWFLALRERLSGIETTAWLNVLLWYELEELLAKSLAPVLMEAGDAAMRRQSVEGNIPVAFVLGQIRIADWANEKAAQEARLIADETRLALYESLTALQDTGWSDEQQRTFLLESGVFGLNRRYAGVVVRQSLANGEQEGQRRGETLFQVRGELITTGNAVDAVAFGMAVAAWLWERDGYEVVKTWFAQIDELTCPVCRSLHMQTVRRDEPFVDLNGEHHNHPKAHLNCRCFVQYEARREEERFLEFF